MGTSSQRFASARKLSVAFLALLLMPAGLPTLADSAVVQGPEDLFVLRLIEPAQNDFAAGRNLILQAYAPYDFAPIAGLELTVLFETDEGEAQQRFLTDAQGEAFVPLETGGGEDPSSCALSHCEVTVSATHRGVTRTVETTLWWGRDPEVLLSTDRRLYQPGQVVHSRGLWFRGAEGPLRRHAVELKIIGPEERVVAKVERTTSELGIASFDWSIPVTARAGDYRVAAEPGGWDSDVDLRIHPYEPAQLLVDARPRRPFFLPGESAEIEVLVTLPDGTPLPGVQVDSARVRQRDYGCGSRPEPWAGERTEPRETDDAGRALVEVEIGEDPAELRWHGWDDLVVEVRAEDPLTGRSESLPLKLRISRYPVHLSLLGNQRPAPLPSKFWVLAQDAAGEPKPGIAVELRRRIDDFGFEGLQRVVTNRLGLAALDTLPLEEDDWQLVAFDGPRLVGSHEPRLWPTEEPFVIDVDRPLRRVGEPLGFTIHSARDLPRVRFEVATEGRVLASQTFGVRRGVEELVIPYQDTFRGPLTLQATVLDPRAGEDEDVVDSVAVVVYPGKVSRQLELSSDRSSYRPGETARLLLEHSGAKGPSAIALAVVDRASEARQTSEGLGFGPSLLMGAADHGKGSKLSILDLDPWRTSTLEALDRLPPAERQRDDVQELARALLADLDLGWRDEDLDHPFHQVPSHLREHYAVSGQDLAEALDSLASERNPRIVDTDSLFDELRAREVDPSTLRDPWGQPYQLEVSVGRSNRRILVRSNGWDTKPETRDDLVIQSVSWPFASHLGAPLDRAIARLHREGRRLPTSVEDVAQILAAEGLDWWSERDPWGTPYRLRWDLRRHFRFQLLSAGPDGRWETDLSEGDDVLAWTVSYDLSTRLRQRLRSALAHADWDQGFEGDGAAFGRQLVEQGDDPDGWLDFWGRPYYFELQQRQLVGSGHEKHEALFVSLWTLGADGRRGTDDDRPLASVTRRITPPDSGSAGNPSPQGSGPRLAARGLLSGQILLCDGFPVPGVWVMVTPEASGERAKGWHALTNESGLFEIRLPPGTYQILAQLEGMQTLQMERVIVAAGERTSLELVMSVAAEEETIVVSGEPRLASPTELTRRAGRGSQRQAPTPRLRRDFRETLFWLAEATTDDAGRLEIEVPLADNLTRWSLAALASDQSGHVSTAEHEVVVRQPFAIEPNLPPLLTVGDRLGIPVVINNGTGGSLAVDLEVAETEGGSVAESRLGIEIPAGVTRHDVLRSFPTPGEHGLRLTASAAPLLEDSQSLPVGDAVWKTTRVEVDGAPQHRTINQLLSGDGTLEIEVPRAALEGLGQLEVVVYEDFEEHLLDTLAALARRPVGCAEQTTSTAWANLLLLEQLLANGEPQSEQSLRARRHLEIAVEALQEFQRDDGGFGYWRSATRSDAALTAYVMEFLLRIEALSERSWPADSAQVSTLGVDAAPKDPAWIARAAAFLATWSHQQIAAWSAGRMPPDDLWHTPRLPSRTLALVAHSLARHGTSTGSGTSRGAAEEALALWVSAPTDGLREVATQTLQSRSPDPYVLALALHTHLALEDRTSAVAVARQLAGLATRQQAGQSWDLAGATPFWGWRRSARLETTALVVEGLLALTDELAEERVSKDGIDGFQAAIRDGLTYLLLEKDRSGLWTSTQATLRVLRALDLALPTGDGEDTSDLRLTLAGKPIEDGSRVEGEGEARRWIVPVGRGRHRLEVTSGKAETGSTSWRLVQVRTRYVVPWKHSRAERRSEVLDFEVDCGPERLEVGELAHCRIAIDRRPRSGGMVIAEIGLPPGAEVDRAALLELQQQGIIQRYESWPGRAVLYLWPRQEPVRFELPWRPRLAVHGKTQPSRLWDYYDPDEEVLLAPSRFRIGELR